MAIEVVMPRLGWTMEKGTLVEWLKAPGERVLARHALGELTSSDRLEKLRRALMGDHLAVHRWMIEIGEVETLLGLIASEEQQRRWLSFILQDPPPPPTSSKDNEGLWRITMWKELLGAIPMRLLTSPQLDEDTRAHILTFTQTYWQKPRHTSFITALVKAYEGDALEELLVDLFATRSFVAATAAASVMVHHRAPTRRVRDLVLEHLDALYKLDPATFRNTDCMPWLHPLLTDEDAGVRHTALALARLMGDKSTLLVLLNLRRSGDSGLEEDALAFATEKLFEVFGDQLEQTAGQLTLSESRGGELSVMDAVGGELELTASGEAD